MSPTRVLLYDSAENPVKALGNIPESGFLILVADGSVHTIQPTVKPNDLRIWIQRNDDTPSPKLPGLKTSRFDDRGVEQSSSEVERLEKGDSDNGDLEKEGSADQNE